MSKRYIITLMAANRVGIMAAVTTALAELDGDLQEASQTVMQKFFTLFLAAEFPDHRDPQVIVDHIRDVCRPYRIEVSLKDPAEERLQEDWDTGFVRYVLTVEGHDQPGVMRRLSAHLASAEVDIAGLHAVRNEDRSLVMVVKLAVPERVNSLALQKDLEELGNTMGLSMTLHHESLLSATHDPRPVRVSRRPQPE